MTLPQAKKQLEIPSSICDHDDQLTELITMARELTESDASIVAADGEYTYTLEGFPFGNIELPFRNATSVTSLTWTDAEGNQNLMDSADYVFVQGAVWPYIQPASGTWPTVTATTPTPVAVVFQAGYASQSLVPQLFIQQCLAVIGNLWLDRGESTDDGGLGRVYEALNRRQFCQVP